MNVHDQIMYLLTPLNTSAQFSAELFAFVQDSEPSYLLLYKSLESDR